MFNIAIIGSGYIGLVIGACISSFGYNVTFVDIDKTKINKLKNGIIHIYEPGLEELFKKNIAKNRINFTTDIVDSIKKNSLIFIAVNTPTGKEGKADISAVKNVAEVIGQNLNEDKIICIKSTVPIGTHKIVEQIIKEKNDKYNVEIVSIPEFLKEGTAINDFLNPDRIVIGTKSKKAFELLKGIMLSTNCEPDKIIWTDNGSAETIKYVSNSFLALKISFINEIANFCDQMDIDVMAVADAVGLDKRIGNQCFKPSPGWGGSCFPKDVLALIMMAKEAGINLKSVEASYEINLLQKKLVFNRLKKLLNNDLKNKTIAVLGLAFKANTDDVREAPATYIINQLLKDGAMIKVYDPKAMDNLKFEFPNLLYCKNEYETVQDSDAILILTEWPQFKNLDFQKISEIVNQKVIFDTRNILDIEQLKKMNFKIDAIGRSIKAKEVKRNIFYYKDKKFMQDFC